MSKSFKTRAVAAAAYLLFLLGCGANDSILQSGKGNASQNNAPAKSSIEQDLTEMRTAGFTYIYVLRRKDGGVIDSEDKGVIRVNTAGANRRVSSDSDRAFVIGSNPPLPPANMMALYARFAVENYSSASPADANANSNK